MVHNFLIVLRDISILLHMLWNNCCLVQQYMCSVWVSQIHCEMEVFGEREVC